MVVIGIVGVLLSVAVFNLQRYTNNTNLKNMARDIASDYQKCKAKAVSESRIYYMVFSAGTSSRYWIYSLATASHPLVLTQKLSSDYGSSIQIQSASFTGGPWVNWIQFETRGTSSTGTVVLTNSIASKATIKSNVTGKAYVTFDMK
ncbi:MAG: hypothetical protein CVU71_17605 [Deltaproteobacteria bacterium HGW-Deltaproteobacteria-6]|nr:MAG: hypothetical protein CVU71_17605 [Deltaproteobacteria bacterium HGW-Deltaproteobacteria-6]